MFTKYMYDLRREFGGYNAKTFGQDLFAGLTVTAVALPLALAFGVSSGATAAAGLVTAIISGLIMSLLSGASYQISGPTGAMTAVLVTLVAQYGLQGMFIATFIAGAILVVCGVFKLGRLVYAIPGPVITGFTSGIAIIIILGQIDNILGMTSTGENHFAKIASYFTSGQTLNVTALLITVGVAAIMFLYPKKLAKYLPSSLAVIIIAVVVNMIFDLPVATIGEIPRTIFLDDRLSFGSLNLGTLSGLLVPALSIAALGMVESLLCGASAGKLKGEPMDADRELLSQGVGNLLIPFFGGVPSTAAIARTSVAIKSGGQTRLVGIIHSVGIIASMFLLGGIMAKIPLAALAGVLVVTAIRMNEWPEIKYIFKKRFRSGITMYLVTMIATVIFDLTVAIIIGIIVAVIIVISKLSKIEVNVADVDPARLNSELKFSGDMATVVYITGPIFFLSERILHDKLEAIEDKKIVILSMRGVPLVDLSAGRQLFELVEEMREKGIRVMFSSINTGVNKTLDHLGFEDSFGSENFFWSVDQALKSITD